MMPDREKVIKGLRDLRRYLEDKEWSDKRAGSYFETVTDAIALLKEQEALLNKAYELLADMNLDLFCDELMCDDGWCDEHCTIIGPTPECIERWLRKQISEGR